MRSAPAVKRIAEHLVYKENISKRVLEIYNLANIIFDIFADNKNIRFSPQNSSFGLKPKQHQFQAEAQLWQKPGLSADIEKILARVWGIESY